MGNRKSREGNKLNAAYLREAIRAKLMANHVCPNCGKKGEGHWHQIGLVTLAQFLRGEEAEGFYSCQKAEVINDSNS